MANMNYCAFENTNRDMQQVLYILQDAVDDGLTYADLREGASSVYEAQAMDELVHTARLIVEAYERLGSDEWMRESRGFKGLMITAII